MVLTPGVVVTGAVLIPVATVDAAVDSSVADTVQKQYCIV